MLIVEKNLKNFWKIVFPEIIIPVIVNDHYLSLFVTAIDAIPRRIALTVRAVCACV